MTSLTISEHTYTNKNCLIIAEVAQAHDGSLGFAHAFIDAVARTDADAIKFQTHIAQAESSILENWRVKFSLQDTTRFDYWKRMEFTEDQWIGLKHHCDDKNLLFISSPFSVEAVDLLERVGMPVWKIASGEVANPFILDRVIQTNKPILLSSGMSDMVEIDRAVTNIRGKNIPFAMLQCTSAYPCPPEKWGLGMIPLFRNRYDSPVGLSDHSGTIYAGLAAATIGVEVLEVHVTLSRDMFGPDVSAPVTIEELEILTEGVRKIQTSMNSSFDKDQFSREQEPLRKLFNKSIMAKIDLSKGSIIKASDLTSKKPGTGIPASELQNIIGKSVNRDVKAGEFILYSDLGL